MSVAIALSVLKFSYSTWQKIPKNDKERIKKALKEGNQALAKRIAKKYHERFKNPKTMKCRVKGCDTRIRIYKDGKPLSFGERMAKLRSHRKRKHPTAHKKSIKKGVESRKK